MSAVLEVRRIWAPGERVRLRVDGVVCELTYDQAALRARALHADERGRRSELLAARVRLGQFLLQVRGEAVKRGVWRAWLETCGVHVRTAQRAMRLAEGGDAVVHAPGVRSAELAVGARTKPSDETNRGSLGVRVWEYDERDREAGSEGGNEENHRTEPSDGTNRGSFGVRVGGENPQRETHGAPPGAQPREKGASGAQETLESIWDLAARARSATEAVCALTRDHAGLEEEVRELVESFIDELDHIRGKAVAA